MYVKVAKPSTASTVCLAWSNRELSNSGKGNVLIISCAIYVCRVVEHKLLGPCTPKITCFCIVGRYTDIPCFTVTMQRGCIC